MSEAVVRDLIVALLGVGGAAFIGALVKSYLALRDSAEGREDKAIARLERYERDCRAQLKQERAMGAYWYRVAGIYAYVLERSGIPEPPLPPPPDTPEKQEDDN